MSQPWGYNYRDAPGIKGVVARWWYARRVRVIRENLRKLREKK